MEKRYLKNMKMLTESEIEKLGRCSSCVVGCGGLGGYIVEMLGRLGIGRITAVDSDVFDETNLNRQLLSATDVIGISKAETAQNRLRIVNPLVEVVPVIQKLSKENAGAILAGHDVVIDAVDNIETRMLLQEECEELDIPLIHGAIAGWYGQVTTVFPGDRSLAKLYSGKQLNSIEKELGNPSFTPALVASIQVSEALKLFIGKGELLRKKVLYIDLLSQEYTMVEI